MSYSIATAESVRIADGMRGIISGQKVAYGGWCAVPSAFATEVVSASGCDWLCIDLQHGLVSDEHMRVMLQAAAIRRTPVLVRVSWNEPAAIMCALDAGAEGVIVPMVNTPEDAERAVAACRYPPLGYRSWGPMRWVMAQPGFGAELGNEQTICIVMIETVQAVENLSQILAVRGVDGVLVGQNDLAISHSGSNDAAGKSPRDVAMIELIVDACQQHGVPAGITCANGAEARRWAQVGFKLLGLPSDAALIGQGMAAALAAAREGNDVL